MKRVINLLILLGCSWQLSAQFYLGPNTTVTTTDGGASLISVVNGDIILDGNFTASNNNFHVVNNSGNDFSISGSGQASFDKLTVATGNRNLNLDKDITVQEVVFESGNFDLNGHELLLNGTISGEDEMHSFIGSNGGAIVFQTSLNAPTNTNPGNLGATISSNKNLGGVVIRRSHVPAVGDNGEGIKRQYSITPSNNTDLDATLRFHYLDKELNNLAENDLELWRNGGSGWTAEGSSGRNSIENWIELSGINSFSDWTAATSGFSKVVELNGGELSVGEVFPNPIRQGVNEAFLPIKSPKNLDINLSLFDQLGRVVYRQSYLLLTGENLIRFNVEDLSPGITFIQIEAEGNLATYKLMVQ
ncbi:MAG: T9SS type A sorting domain-containing protein [Saprospiraceae bacterium]